MKKLKSLLSMVTDEAAVHHQKLTVIIITRVRSCFTETFKCPWPKKKNNWLLLNKNSFLWKILQQQKTSCYRLYAFDPAIFHFSYQRFR